MLCLSDLNSNSKCCIPGKWKRLILTALQKQTTKWRADPPTWGHGPRVFEMFPEPTCPLSVQAFGKLDDLLKQSKRGPAYGQDPSAVAVLAHVFRRYRDTRRYALRHVFAARSLRTACKLDLLSKATVKASRKACRCSAALNAIVCRQ